MLHEYYSTQNGRRIAEIRNMIYNSKDYYLSEEDISELEEELLELYVELPNGRKYALEDIADYLDEELREQVHIELAPCSDQKFIDYYCKLHREKYGEDFTY